MQYPTIIATVGGEGTRLYPLTLNQTKALVDICDKATLSILFEVLARQYCNRFIIASKGFENTTQLNKYFKTGEGFFSRLNLPLGDFKYQPNYEDKGSGDSVRFCMEHYDIREDVMVVGGDNVLDMDIKPLMEFHKKTGAIATVVLKELSSEEDISQFGVAKISDENRIIKFVEKPRHGSEPSRLINTAVYIFSPEIREVFKKMGDKVKDIGHDVIPYLTENDYPVYGYLLDGYWADVGTPEQLLKTTIDVLDGKIKHGKFKDECEYAEGQCVYSTTLEQIKKQIETGDLKLKGNVFLARDCRIGKNVEIEHSYIGHTSIIKDGVKIKDSAIMSFANIGNNVKINKAILGRYTTVQDNSVIDAYLPIEFEGVSTSMERIPVIGGGGVVISKGSVIGPGKRVAPIKYDHQILSTGKFIELGMDQRNVYFMAK